MSHEIEEAKRTLEFLMIYDKFLKELRNFQIKCNGVRSPPYPWVGTTLRTLAIRNLNPEDQLTFQQSSVLDNFESFLGNTNSLTKIQLDNTLFNLTRIIEVFENLVENSVSEETLKTSEPK